MRFETTLTRTGAHTTGIEVPSEPSHRKAHVASVESAKAAETRARRVTAVVDKLSS